MVDITLQYDNQWGMGVEKRIAVIAIISLLSVACDRIGSESWCEKQSETPKAEWTLEDAGHYAKYCVLGMDSEKWCEKLEKKPKGDWTANEAAEYAENCIIGRDNNSE